jgi:hypothetical protein
MESRAASYQVVGSCLEHHGRMILNFRVIDSKTGLAMHGVAVSGEAAPSRFLPTVEALTQKLTVKLAGNPIQAPRPASVVVFRPESVRKQTIKRGPGFAVSRAEVPSDRRKEDTVELRPRSATEEEGRSAGAIDDSGRPYTGVIIDCRGLGLDRSMSPRIHREGGETIWSGGEADPDFVVDEGIVVYCRSVEDAKRLRRAGSNPLVLRAIERFDDPFHADPVLANEDAAALMAAARKDGFLKKFNVVFVID